MFARVGRHVRQQYAGFLALFIALGGVSYAAIALPANSVGTKQIKRGAVKNSDLGKSAVTGVKVKNGSLLSADFKAGQLPAGPTGATGAGGPAGPQGPAGETGAQGATGASPATRFARVRSDGVLKTGSAGTTSLRTGTGRFSVTFDRNISPCAFSVTVGAVDGSFSVVSPRITRAESAGAGADAASQVVSVAITDNAGADSDAPFHLIVYC